MDAAARENLLRRLEKLPQLPGRRLTRDHNCPVGAATADQNRPSRRACGRPEVRQSVHLGSVPGMPETPSATAALEELTGHEAWAVIRLRESPTVTLVGGSLSRLERLADIPLEEGPPDDGRRFDRLVAVPFRQVTERGFVAHDDGTPLAVVDIDTEREVPLDELIEALPDEEVTFEDEGGFDTSDEDYAGVVARIIRDEIGNGEGANLVVGRHYRAQLRDWNADKALTVLRRLLTSERGAYWTYCFWTGDRFLIGATPERHVSVHGGDVRMNPISGTFRLRGLEATERKQRCWSSSPTRRRSSSSSWSSTRS